MKKATKGGLVFWSPAKTTIEAVDLAVTQVLAHRGDGEDEDGTWQLAERDPGIDRRAVLVRAFLEESRESIWEMEPDLILMEAEWGTEACRAHADRFARLFSRIALGARRLGFKSVEGVSESATMAMRRVGGLDEDFVGGIVDALGRCMDFLRNRLDEIGRGRPDLVIDARANGISRHLEGLIDLSDRDFEDEAGFLLDGLSSRLAAVDLMARKGNDARFRAVLVQLKHLESRCSDRGLMHLKRLLAVMQQVTEDLVAGDVEPAEVAVEALVEAVFAVRTAIRSRGSGSSIEADLSADAVSRTGRVLDGVAERAWLRRSPVAAHGRR